jgi:hypothetical protein
MNQNEAVGMSYQEKSNIVSLITTLIVSVPYMWYVFQQFRSSNFTTAEEFNFWAIALLVLIPIRIVAEIVIHIIMSIITAIVTQKDEESLTDERDELIELKRTRNSTFAFIIGFVVSLVVVYFVKTPSSMFIVIFISGFLSELVGIFSQIYYYKKG